MAGPTLQQIMADATIEDRQATIGLTGQALEAKLRELHAAKQYPNE